MCGDNIFYIPSGGSASFSSVITWKDTFNSYTMNAGAGPTISPPINFVATWSAPSLAAIEDDLGCNTGYQGAGSFTLLVNEASDPGIAFSGTVGLGLPMCIYPGSWPNGDTWTGGPLVVVGMGTNNGIAIAMPNEHGGTQTETHTYPDGLINIDASAAVPNYIGGNPYTITVGIGYP